MSFDERYQLLDLAEDKGVKAFVAREISTDRKVTVFLFVGEQAHKQADLLAQLRVADRLQLPELVEVGDNRGTPYVVTQLLGGLSDLSARVSRLKASPSISPEHKPGEFSKAGVWHIPPELQSTPHQAEKLSGESLLAGKQQSMRANEQSAPGSFTQMFQAPAHPIGEPTVDVPKPPLPATPQPEQSAPGSFTQMFQAPAHPIGEPTVDVPKPPLPATPQPEQSAPGSFTQVFQAPAHPIGEPTVDVPKPPLPATPQPEQSAPGSFTQVFQAPAHPIGEPTVDVPKPPLPATPQPEQSAPGEFTRMFQASGPSVDEAKLGLPKPPPPLATARPAQSAPGEFTRFFNAASSSPATSTPIPNKPEAQGEFARIFESGDRGPTPPSTGTGIFDQSASAAAPTHRLDASPSAPTPPRAFAPPAGEFTKIFGETSLEIPTLGPMAPTLTAPPSPAGSPGEYTRMFGAQPVPSEPIVEPAPGRIRSPETQVPAKQTSKLVPLLIVMVVVLLAAIAVIVVAMRK